MLLKELLYVVNDSTNISILEDGELISRYDGRNSIEIFLNDAEIVEIKVSNNELFVEINNEAFWNHWISVTQELFQKGIDENLDELDVFLELIEKGFRMEYLPKCYSNYNYIQTYLKDHGLSENLRYFELEFNNEIRGRDTDGDVVGAYSICIRGDQEPSYQEAEELCKEEMQQMGYKYVVSISEIDAKTARETYSVTHDSKFPIFHKKTLENLPKKEK